MMELKFNIIKNRSLVIHIIGKNTANFSNGFWWTNSGNTQITYTYDVNGNMATKTAVNGELSAVTEFVYDTFDRTASMNLGIVCF